MDIVTEATIQDMIRAGRIVEARTLLTMQESALSAEELQGLNLELEQQLARAEAAISQAEELEIAGKTEEAKALYESVLLFAVDYPGIQEHVKRLDEALLLTKAVKRRSRRIRESPPAPKEGAAGKRYLTVLGAGLAVGLSVAILLLVLAKPQPSQVPRSEKTTPAGPLAKEKASPEAPVAIAAQQRTASPAIPASALPAPLPPEKSQEAKPPQPSEPLALTTTELSQPEPAPPPPEPAILSQNELPQSSSAPQVHPENLAAVMAPSPLPTHNHQKQKDVYTVRPGDSLSLIAERLFCNEAAWRKIHQLNRDEIADPRILHPGMVLRLNGIENRCPAEQ